MDAELVREGARARTRHSWRQTAVSTLGPLTALAGLIWAIVQPYRITLFEPYRHGFWYLAVQPPLLVILAAAVFHFWVVPGLLSDLEEVEERST
jgi:hypothetical protein